ncbi:MAG: helix-turn-helix transcriptional regulator [Clostridium sp.]|uniref:helix-turn-helix domain-containing protein n=1 Tax=Bacillota TaxID=1239 RepID=UPI00290B4428|nr:MULTISPECIES: helix-turn-helix transcriptional regulator [Bacillota]MDU3677670.1 helix-turn-helix transcriptional regulator [Clostridium sp.]MDU5739573.1 helix-turn-helix transcriptional regulator [Clostridium sp.]MDU5763398.1 helix-turn-helix transcriptional regulator [Veillonella sp.]MDU5784007.1 helix-turn-helix transcriptional regulator [Clostridium sp.]MDU6876285.1 helix-turn-helix transcriptional regulator [Clostridium sp.]
MYDLGNLLKELRIENELTQEELANKLNELHDIKLNKGMISKWEANKSEPRFEYIKYMSKLYNVSLDYLLGLSKFKNKEEELADYKNRMNEFAENHNKNFYENKLLNIFNKLNDEGKNEAIKRVDELTELSKYKKENNNKIVEISAKKKEIWQEEEKEHLMPIACHDDNLTEEEKNTMNDIINNFIKNNK